MKIVSSLVALSALSLASAACTIGPAALSDFGWLISTPSEEVMKEKCADAGKAFLDKLDPIVQSCTAELGEFGSLLGLAEDLVCEKQDDGNGEEYCFPVLVSILPVSSVLVDVINKKTPTIDLEAFLDDEKKLRLVHASPRCSRKIVKTATVAARKLAMANDWQINEQIEEITDMVKAVMIAGPDDDGDEVCGKKRDTFFNATGYPVKDEVCEGGKWKECARKLASCTSKQHFKDNFCDAPTTTKIQIGSATIELPNVLYSYYTANKDVVDAYLSQDLSALLPGLLSSEIDITVDKKAGTDTDTLLLRLVMEGYDIEVALMDAVRLLKETLASNPELVTFLQMDMLLPDEAFVDAELLVSGKATVSALEVAGTSAPTTADEVSSAGKLSVGLMSLVAAFFVM